MTLKWRYCLIVFLSALVTASAADIPPAAQLAMDLAEEGSHEAAAVEYRRLALETDTPGDKAGYYLASGWEYLQLKDCELVLKMLDRAEDQDPGIQEEAILLRGESVFADARHDEAKFYFETIMRSDIDAAAGVLVCRRLAHIMIRDGEYTQAKKLLASCGETNQSGLQALDAYTKDRNRSPRIGGLLGLVPGLGYAYSGEYSNALRSLILNSIFIYGMTDTADKEQWGAFAAITFFELTWYTGSIYGGIDAAHRHNRTRLTGCLDAVDGNAGVRVDLSRIPVVSLSFDF